MINKEDPYRTVSALEELYSHKGKALNMIRVLNSSVKCYEMLVSDIVWKSFRHIAGVLFVANGDIRMARKYQDKMFEELVPLLLYVNSDGCQAAKELAEKWIWEPNFGPCYLDKSDNFHREVIDALYYDEHWSSDDIDVVLHSNVLVDIQTEIESIYRYIIDYVGEKHNRNIQGLETFLDICHKFYIDTTSIKSEYPDIYNYGR